MTIQPVYILIALVIFGGIGLAAGLSDMSDAAKTNIIGFCGLAITQLLIYLVSAKAEAKTAASADKAAHEAKRAGDNAEASARIAEQSAKSSSDKLDKIHASTNHAFGVSLLATATALRELADETPSPRRIKAAEIAEKAYRDHEAGQAEAEATVGVDEGETALEGEKP